ncbi:hypothetical protein F3Y22_tig00116997pilonHSYRG00452 [Hibiscus syriacus]|uniref:DUF630 domain-containing protein n=1 Tax=Hibiscus syriacus TaxID=106335 RepID=A0A6A2WLN9_HIBSY|nr:hypothetical protein F3Y22_tig00116997pilonHSYRG00452 [Hibiscus syriacus]
MGCVASRIDNEGRVWVCKKRKKLMKHLVRCRGEFADAQSAYLRALKNTGVTLKSYTNLLDLASGNFLDQPNEHKRLPQVMTMAGVFGAGGG